MQHRDYRRATLLMRRLEREIAQDCVHHWSRAQIDAAWPNGYNLTAFLRQRLADQLYRPTLLYPMRRSLE